MAIYGFVAAPYPTRAYPCPLPGGTGCDSGKFYSCPGVTTSCSGVPAFSSSSHPLGTENSGIDILSEIEHGTPNDLYVGIAATAISVAIGLVVGGYAGYRAGVTSSLLLGVTQAFLVLPLLIIILLFAKVGQLVVGAGLGLTFIMLILGLFGWPGVAYIVRGEILRIRELEFVQAERALGASNTRILFRHILPNTLSPLIVYSSLLIAGNILTEVVISFLGFGDPNTSTWGLILQEGFVYLRTNWWSSVFPGLTVVFCVLGFNLLGDGLSDALNPRLRE
jgi:peptide/nickel transport system permease protein